MSLPFNGVNSTSAATHQFPMSTSSSSSAFDLVQKYLGPPTQNMPPSVSDRLAQDHYALPEYYKGRNLLIENTIEGFIVDGTASFYTTLALPWMKSDDIHVKFNTWHFERKLIDRVPHEGTVRLIESRKSEFHDHQVRRGIGFVLESDFFNTPEGREQYAFNVKSIAQSVQETQDYDTIYAILTSKNYFKMWEQLYGKLNVSYLQIIKDEIERFGCVVNASDGYKRLEIEYHDAKRIMAKQGVNPDLLILWPGAKLFLGTQHPKKTEYWAAGPDANLVLLQGPEVSTFADGKVNVVEVRDFDVYTDAPPIELLTRSITIGEYNTMLAWWRSDANIQNYESRWRDIFIYNENLDKMEKICFKDAFCNARIFSGNSDYSEKLKKFVDLHSKKWKIHDRSADTTFSDEYSNKTPEETPFFLTSSDNQGIFKLINYFGQMDMHAASSKDIEQVAQTLISKIPGEHGEDIRVFHDLVELIRNIEMQEYNDEYWRALVEENLPYSIDQDDQWIGELTPPELTTVPIQEWVPNSYGSLRLPNKNISVLYPAGYANGPGLMTLADESMKNQSPWKHCGMIAAEGVRLINRIVQSLKNILFTCEMFNPQNRSPWFHKPYPIATFFQLLSIERDPIWIAHARPVKSGNKARGNTYGSKQLSSENDVKWNPESIFQSKNRDDNKVTDFTYTSFLTGEEITVPALYIIHGEILSDELRTMQLLGQLSLVAFKDISKLIDGKIKDNNNNVVYKRKLMRFINLYGRTKEGTQNIRRIVIGFRADIASGQIDIPKEIDRLVVLVDQNSKKKDINEAKLLISRYLEITENIIDSDLERDYIKGLSEYKKKELKKLPNDISMSSIKNDIEFVLDSVADVTRFRKSMDVYEDELPKFDFSAPKKFMSDDDDAKGLRLKVQEIVSRAVKINEYITEILSEEEIKEKEKEKELDFNKLPPKKVFAIQDNKFSFFGVEYYRSPLTMSLQLLESIGQKMPEVLIRPSDPTMGHAYPYAASKDTKNLPSDIWRRPNYANIGAIHEKPDFHKITENLSFIGKNTRLKIESQISTKFGSSGKEKLDHVNRSSIGSRKKAKSDQDFCFEDDNDDDDIVDPVESIFQGMHKEYSEEWSKPQLKRIPEYGNGNGWEERQPFTKPFDQSGREFDKFVVNLTRPDFIIRYTNSYKIRDPIMRMIAQCFLTSRADNGEQWLKMIDDDVLVPISLILWRMFIEHDMASGVLMKGGPETGGNMFGHTNFSFGANVSTKMFLGNLTFYSKAMIWKPKNVFVMEHLAPRQYIGGSGSSFIQKKEQCLHLGEEGMVRDRPSIVVTAVPISFVRCDFMMSFTGKHLIPNANEGIDGPPKDTYPSWKYYDYVWGFMGLVTKTHPGAEDYMKRSGRFTPHAFQGQQVNFNRTTRTYNIVEQCQGHRKGGCYEGAKKVWNGKGVHMIYDWHNFERS